MRNVKNEKLQHNFRLAEASLLREKKKKNKGKSFFKLNFLSYISYVKV